jgi:hypothetical protein
LYGIRQVDGEKDVRTKRRLAADGRHRVTVLKGGKPTGIEPERVSELVEEVACWRKANAIHRRAGALEAGAPSQTAAVLPSISGELSGKSRSRPGSEREGLWNYQGTVGADGQPRRRATLQKIETHL